MPTLRIKFGKHLRQLRRERGYTQENLAEVCEISVDFLSLVERGRNAPSFETLDKLATALEVSVAALFKFSEPVPTRGIKRR